MLDIYPINCQRLIVKGIFLMQNLKNTKLLTPIELKLWFTSFFVLLLGFLPLIFNFIWGNHDWNPILRDNSLQGGFIEGRITQYAFLQLFLEGKILPIINTTLGFLIYSLAIVILATRFFEFQTSNIKLFIIITSILTTFTRTDIF